MRRPLLVLLPALLTVSLAAGCADDDKGTKTPPPPQDLAPQAASGPPGRPAPLSKDALIKAADQVCRETGAAIAAAAGPRVKNEALTTGVAQLEALSLVQPDARLLSSILVDPYRQQATQMTATGAGLPALPGPAKIAMQQYGFQTCSG